MAGGVLIAGRAVRQGWRALAMALAVLALASPAPAEGAPKPRRIASLNVCTDQLVLMLGARERLVSVTFLAADPSSSALAEEARGLRLNRGRAEEILPLAPDLVLAGDTAATPTVALLTRLKRRVVVVPLALTLADIPRNIETLAGAIGEEAKGRRMIARFREALARLIRDASPPPGPKPVALLVGPNGVTSGEDSLTGAIIAAAGFANGAAGLGLSGVGRLPLERVIGANPDLLILSSLKVEHPSLAGGFIRHPALERAFAGRRKIRIHHHVWACGTPLVLGAIERLIEARASLRGARRAGRR
jgi:iron complex transport system substrate-binding protein